jgi:TP901 family phage tail tape measure protein
MAGKVTYYIEVDADKASAALLALKKDANLTDAQINEVSSSVVDLGADADKIASDSLPKLEGQVQKTGSSFTQSDSKISAFGKTLNLSVVAFTAAAGTALVALGSKAIEMGSQFETAVSDLSAITGIAGERLNNLANNALASSAQTGIAADQVVEAYKLVASQLAEKIDFGTDEGAKQLQQVSKEALILSRAAGIDLKTAVESTTGIINQFGLEASAANEIINNLAAGSKFGAAEVGDIAEAFKAAGTTAAGANISISDTNAAVQILAANAIKGAEAGTGLRNVFSILQTETDKLANNGISNVNLKTNGLTETLKQLTPLLDNATALAEIFGRENLNAAQILIKNADSVENMSTKLNGTNTAYEQAAIQADTFQVALSKLNNSITGQLIQAFDAVSGPLSGFVGGLAELLAPSENLAESYSKQQERLNILVGTIQTAGISEETRLSVIQDLNTEYPDFVENIDLEKGSNEELSKALKEVNNDYSSRIALAQMDAKIKKAEAEAGELRTKRVAKEREFSASLQKAAKEYGLQIDENADITERYAQVQEQLKAKFTGLGVLIDSALRASKGLKTEYGELTNSAYGLNAEIGKQSEVVAELKALKEAVRQDLIKEGILTETATDKVKDHNKALDETPKSVTTKISAEIVTYQKNVSEIEKSGESVESSIDADILAQSLEIQKGLEADYTGYLRTEAERRSQIGSKPYLDEQALIQKRVNLLASNDEAAKLKSIADIRNQLNLAQDNYNKAKSDEERAIHLDKMNNLEIELFAKLNGISVVEAREAEAHQTRLAQLQEYNQLYSEGAAALSNLSNALSARKIQGIEKEKKSALGRIDAQLKNEKLSEAQKSKLISQRESIEAGYNARMNAEKVKAAKLDKAIAATGVILRTSMAIMSALAMIPPNVPLSIFAGATGAVQLGAVLAQPIPAFEKGGLVRGSEKMIRINEKGEEFVINAKSTAKNRQFLEQLNANPDFIQNVLNETNNSENNVSNANNEQNVYNSTNSTNKVNDSKSENVLNNSVMNRTNENTSNSIQNDLKESNLSLLNSSVSSNTRTAFTEFSPSTKTSSISNFGDNFSTFSQIAPASDSSSLIGPLVNSDPAAIVPNSIMKASSSGIEASVQSLIEKLNNLTVNVEGRISGRDLELTNSEQVEYLNKTRIKW